MIQYFSDDKIFIRNMIEEDAQIFYETYLSYGWQSNIETYENYFKEQEIGIRKVFVAEFKDKVSGICTLVLNPSEGPWAGMNYSEIVDLRVFKSFQNLGIGNMLLEIVEQEAFKISEMVYLAVGLHSGYGEAQRIYVKRGYNFDGSGLWYKGKPLEQYEPCVNDDDLVLFMSKQRNA